MSNFILRLVFIFINRYGYPVARFDDIDTLQDRINDLKEEQYAEQKQS